MSEHYLDRWHYDTPRRGTFSNIHALGTVPIVSIRGKKSGREIKTGDIVTPDDGDLVVTRAFAPAYIPETFVIVGAPVAPSVKVDV